MADRMMDPKRAGDGQKAPESKARGGIYMKNGQIIIDLKGRQN
jgi:hypothetical protein